MQQMQQVAREQRGEQEQRSAGEHLAGDEPRRTVVPLDEPAERPALPRAACGRTRR